MAKTRVATMKSIEVDLQAVIDRKVEEQEALIEQMDKLSEKSDILENDIHHLSEALNNLQEIVR